MNKNKLAFYKILAKKGIIEGEVVTETEHRQYQDNPQNAYIILKMIKDAKPVYNKYYVEDFDEHYFDLYLKMKSFDKLTNVEKYLRFFYSLVVFGILFNILVLIIIVILTSA